MLKRRLVIAALLRNVREAYGGIHCRLDFVGRSEGLFGFVLLVDLQVRPPESGVALGAEGSVLFRGFGLRERLLFAIGLLRVVKSLFLLQYPSLFVDVLLLVQQRDRLPRQALREVEEYSVIDQLFRDGVVELAPCI